MNDLTYLPIQENSFLDPNTTSGSSSKKNTEEVNLSLPSEIYEGVFKHSFHAMYIETLDGLIMKFNEKFSKLFGYSQTEMCQLENTDLFEITESSFVDFIDRRNNNGIANGEITAIKKSGKRFPCRISSLVYQSESGDKRAMNTLVDISDDLSARWDFPS